MSGFNSEWRPPSRRNRVRHRAGIVSGFTSETPSGIFRNPQTERLRRLARSILRRCAPEEIVADNPAWRLVEAYSYGDLYVLEQLWRRLGVGEVIGEVLGKRRFEFDVERALFAMVANRALAPSSKLYCYEQWLSEDIRIEGAQRLKLQHLYRAMDFLEASRETIEKAIYFRMADLLNLDVELVFYDTTSLHFETDEPDRGVGPRDEVHGSKAAGRKIYRAPRKRGHSKNGRYDAPQIVVGLAVTRDGFPLRHWIFPGNTVDVTTVAAVKGDLRGWQLSRCVFVGDAGMVSAQNLAALARAGGKYIVCMPINRGGEVANAVLTRPGRYQEVAENLQVKEVIVGDGERRRRYVVCHNPQEAERQARHRAEVLKELAAEIEGLHEASGGSHSKRVCELRASGRYGRYIRLTPSGHPRIDQANVQVLARLDGKFVVHSNDDTLSAADLALGYKQLQRVEVAWRMLKSGLKLRPVYHWAPHSIHAHVSLTFLLLRLELIAEQACGDTWRKIRDDLKQIKLAQLSSSICNVSETTEPAPAALKRLKSLNIPKPPPVLQLG